jgi:hypothetical protein
MVGVVRHVLVAVLALGVSLTAQAQMGAARSHRSAVEASMGAGWPPPTIERETFDAPTPAQTALVSAPPSPTRKLFDAAVLRPLGFVQVVGGAALFVVAYPVSLLVGGSETVKEACLTGPTDQVFRAKLGDF